MKTKYKINYSIIRIGILFFFLPIASFSLFGQSANQNYIRTRTMTTDDASKCIEVIQYYDGLGRPVETVQKGITPTGKDLISYQEYDAFGRPDYSWLPAVSASSYGNFVAFTSFKTLSFSTYNNTSLNLVSDDKPYSRTVYEASPLNRILQEFGPGKDWHNSNKPVKTEYPTNTSSLTIPYFTCSDTRDNVTVTRSNYYPVNQLYIVLKTDEDGNEYLEAKNKLGQLVCTRQKAESSTYFYTCYVYDSFGNLKVVLPPEAVSQHTSGSLSETNQLFKDYVFAYKYDSRNRCIGKKIPGADWVQYVYDKADQLIFTKTGAGIWFFTIPDVFGRVVMTGECRGMFLGTSTLSQNISVGCLDNVVVQAVPQNVSPKLDGYYTVTAARPANAIFYEVYYYDNYRFLTDKNVTAFQRPEYHPEMNPSGYDKPDTVSVKGLMTGKKVWMVQENLNATDINSYYYTTLYYDRKARLVQSRNRNHLSGYDMEYYRYNFTGQVTGKKAVNIVKPNGTITTTEVYTYQYDAAGRLGSTQLSINGGATKVLASNTYDELGRLKTSMSNGQNILRTDYKYNIRSWIQKISSPKFTEDLEYTKNGNILSLQWTQPDKTSQVARKYTFAYDGLSRLKSASFTGGTSGENVGTAYIYDKNGNITSLKRKDAKTASSTSGYLDDLTFVYSNNNHSNQVMKITDAASASREAQSMDFKDYANTPTEYAYNANGAMTKDLNRGISSITYNNQLNLPVSMEILSPVAEARIRYTYLATGEKVKTEHRWNVNYSTSPIIGNSPVFNSRTRNTIRSLEYIGNKVFEDGVLTKILYENGYYEGGQYYFYVRDHLGNNRLTIDQNGNVKQSVHYFPFGATMHFTKVEDSFQDYKYNSKELERMHGLNQYDYHARGYDPVIGRFMTMDPLAEKYYSISPYAYCMNNPVKYIDPTGMAVYLMFGDGRMVLALADQTDEDRKNSDKLYRIKDNADSKVRSVTIKDKSLLPQLAGLGEGGHSAITNSSSDAFNLFKFGADNSDVEWSLSGFKDNGVKYYLNTQHSSSYAETGESNGIFDAKHMLFNVHSHPGENGIKGGSGYFWDQYQEDSDASTATNLFENLKYSMPTLYVYHPYSQSLFNYTPNKSAERTWNGINSSSQMYKTIIRDRKATINYYRKAGLIK